MLPRATILQISLGMPLWKQLPAQRDGTATTCKAKTVRAVLQKQAVEHVANNSMESRSVDSVDLNCICVIELVQSAEKGSDVETAAVD
jgi:hypothetical protein